MKIDPNQEIVKSVHAGKTTGPDKQGDNKFDTILKDAMNNQPSRASAGSEKPQMVDSISSIQQTSPFAVQDSSLVGRTENLLNILEEYQAKLNDPHITLRDIHPLIERMETEKETLTPLLNSLPPGDGLKEILNHALITSSLEVIKFNRGDYVDA